MTKNGEIDVKSPTAKLTEGYEKAIDGYQKILKKSSNDNERGMKLGEKLSEKYENDGKLEIVKVIKENIGILEKIEMDFEDIVRELKKVYGTDEVVFVLQVLKVHHDCFHLDLEANSVAINPKLEESMDASKIELTVPLLREWEELFEQMVLLNQSEVSEIYLEAYYEDLYRVLEEHKDQLKYMRNVVPTYISRCRLDTRPHLNVEVGWDLDGRDEGAYYSDLLDLNKLVDEDLPRQILRPIMVESNRWELIPLIMPVTLAEDHPDLIETIKDKIERRLKGSGEIQLGAKMEYEYRIEDIMESSPETLKGLLRVRERKIGGYTIKTINKLLEEQIFRADILINSGIENYAGTGERDRICEVIEGRNEMLRRSRLTGRDLSADVKIPITGTIREKYRKRFKDFKKEILRS